MAYRCVRGRGECIGCTDCYDEDYELEETGRREYYYDRYERDDWDDFDAETDPDEAPGDEERRVDSAAKADGCRS